MGTIISTGVGSGLDIAGLVKKLVAAEGGPKSTRLDTAEAKAQAKISALGSLRSVLATFRGTLNKLGNLESFRGREVTLSNENSIAATATSSAAPASYSIEIEQLAQAHKLRSEPFAAGASVGTGTLTIATGGKSFDILIDSTNNTVNGIAAAINASAGAKVIASVITGADGKVTLTLAAREMGSANGLTIAQSGGDGQLAALEFSDGSGALTEIAEALDAHVQIDGVDVTSATNTIRGAIEGVEIDLLRMNPDEPTTTLVVGYDRKGARAAIDSLVKNYNGVVDAIKSVASYNAETHTGGPLFGDAGVTNLVYQLRRELSSNVTGVDASVDMLAKIGVSVTLDGKLQVDGTKLDAAFTANFDEIGKLFSLEDTGVAVKLNELLEPYLQTGGVLDTRNKSLKSSIDDIADQRETLTQRLEALQARYLRQFNALDGLLSQLQSTSTFLSQQLSKLPGNALFNND